MHKGEEHEEITWILYDLRRHMPVEGAGTKTFIHIGSKKTELARVKGVNLALHEVLDSEGIQSLLGVAEETKYAFCNKCFAPLRYPQDLAEECAAGGQHEVPITPAFLLEDTTGYADKVWEYIQERLQRIRDEEEGTTETKNPQIQKSATVGKQASTDNDARRVRLTFLPPTFQNEN